MKKEWNIDLAGTWNYCLDPDDSGEKSGFSKVSTDCSGWKNMEIPNNWYLTEVGDYFGVVWFRREIDLPECWSGKEVYLKFKAVDYYADVWLNDQYLGWHEGYFTPFEFRVTDYLKPGKNVLVVKNDSPRDPTEYVMCEGQAEKDTPLSMDYRQHWAKDLTLVKGHHVDAMHRPGAMTKFRGDGNSGGIWQTVELTAYDTLRITKTKLYPQIVCEDDSAIISIDMLVENLTNKMVDTEIDLVITPNNFDGSERYTHKRKIQLQPGVNEVKLIKTMENPELWYTWDFGFPHLYDADICIGGYACENVRFGIKEFTHDAETGHFSLNGKRIFIRGMRYLSSLWISEMNEDRYRKDLEMMLDLNINSIRIGSHVELDEFYSLCDEMGFVVWQVFPLHYCYSDTDDLIERCVPMMKQMVEMFFNHASIGAWSVYKEPKVYALPNMPNNYGRLCQLMIEAAKTVDPIRWMHSGDYEEGVMNITVGQCYPWDWDIKKHEVTPIIVEFGCGTFVSVESMKKALPGKELWPPDWDLWEYYNCFYHITFDTAGLKMTETLEEFIENAQEYQARCIKEQIEYCRQIKYKPVGSMYLYYWSEPWPNIGASGLLDYYRVPFKSYESFKQVYTPILVSFEWGKDHYILGKQKQFAKGELFTGNFWLTNDRLEPVDNASLCWSIKKVGQCEAVLSGEHCDVGIADDCAKVINNIVWKIPKDIESGVYVLEMEVTGASGGRLSWNNFEFEIC